MGSEARKRNFVTKKVWDECGTDYLVEHEMGNVPY
jgi:hypothetical protein